MLLREARDRLNADLQQFYGVRLTDMYEGRVLVSEVADFAVNVPRGSRVAEWVGGWGAITAEEHALRRIEHAIIAVNSTRRVPEPQPPKSIRGAQRMAETNRKNRAHVASMKDKWRG